uniref:RanBP2-type domain-containing protein n=1 Tax=Eutreptiella gymnastica TaxID=73025 RepID=A0A7S1N9I6_9EUGL|mmetsp:Transcript_142204/g.247914  ORF Transcript_142204/g.247914 Transcript_142204/m.247914 type:complete len:146 (+) Transcript_142204:116-553(+)
MSWKGGGKGKGRDRAFDNFDWSSHPNPPPKGIDPGVGDWECPNPGCGNWNWAKRRECNKCFAKNPKARNFKPSAGEINADRSAGLDTGKVMSGGGQAVDTYEARRDVYKEEQERKRRREEEKKETEKRKTEGQRCKFCKRFTCIC